MAVRFDSFHLNDLAAKPEDAFRLCSLAMSAGQRIQGYSGDYFRMYLGDTMVIVRTMLNPATGEEELLGMDTHAVSDCIWECRIIKDVTPANADPLSRRLLVSVDGREDTALIDVLCADIIPDFLPGMTVHLNMAAFPLRIAYSETGKGSVVEATEDAVLLEGVVKDAKVGESRMGLELMTKFVRLTVETPMGDVELCHPFDLVADDQKDLVKNGSIVSAYCHLSGDLAIEKYTAGIHFNIDQDMAVLAAFLRNGGIQRLRPILRSDCVTTFLKNRQEGLEMSLSLLEEVGQQLREAGLYHAVPGRITGGEGLAIPGQKCLLLGNSEGEYAFLCLFDVDSLGRIRSLNIINDTRYEFEPM
ncbi:MAG: hypothetical protein IKC03_06610 [Oscillospiraceae bacterium]|nr:hypothetical protein [Oscillospiraceae bacterium]